MSDTKLDRLLIRFKIARNQRIAVPTYQNAPPGSLDVERHELGNPLCYRSIKFADEGFILKTIIIADPTLGMNHNADPSLVAQLIKLLLEKDHSTIYLWTGEFIPINSLNDFYSYYRACTSLLHAELVQFKEKKQLNHDNLIVLDNRTLQAIAHYILNTPDKPTQTTIDNPFSNEKESIEPRYFTSDMLMGSDSNQRQRILAWHKEHDYPLHLKLNGFATSKFPEFISYVQEYNQIILYFNELIHSDVEIWLSHLMQLPASQIIGLYQGNDLSSRSIVTLINSIHQLPQLQYLSINIPSEHHCQTAAQYRINFATLDLSKHQQLNYLSITLSKDINANTQEAPYLLDSDTSSHFLKTLPSSLNYLHLPFRWTYSFPVLNQVLTKHLPFLKELGSTDDEATNKSPLISDMQHSILLPRVKIMKQGQILPLEGIETNQLYRPFADNPPEAPYIHTNALDFSHDFNKIMKYCNQPHMTLAIALSYIDEIIEVGNLKDLSVLKFNNDIYLDMMVLLLISTRLSKVKELIFATLDFEEEEEALQSKVFVNEMKAFLKDYVWELDRFSLQTFNEVDLDLRRSIFFNIEVKHHVILDTEYLYISDLANFKDVPSIDLMWDSEAGKFRNAYPNVVISTSYNYLSEDAIFHLSVDELKEKHRTQEQESSDESDDSDTLINDTDTIEDSSDRLSARQLFHTLEGQPVPVNYDRMEVRSIKSTDQIENAITISPGKIIRYDHNIPDKALVYKATHSYDSTRRSSDTHILPMLHPQDTLYKISTSHPIELSYDSKRKVYLIKKQNTNSPLTITYQFHSAAYILNKQHRLEANVQQITQASRWINQFRPFFYLFNSIQFTPEGINGLECLNIIPPQIQPLLICAYFADFGSGKLQLGNEYPLAHEVDNAIFHQKVGACRHRSNLAFKMLQALVDQGMCSIEANLTSSDVHQFLELCINDTWVTVCLGGFDAQIDLQNTPIDNATQTTQDASQLEEISAGTLSALNQPHTDRYFPYEDNIDGWEELYVETEQEFWNGIIEGFDPYSNDLMEQSNLFNNDNLFPQEAQNVIIQKETPAKQLFLLAYPKLSFTDSQNYQYWLEEQLESKRNAGGHILLVVDSIDQQIDALQRNACEYITENNGCFSSISDFQHIKFAELHVDKRGKKKFLANRLGTLIEQGKHGDLLWININHYQAATINPLFDHRKKLRDKQIPDGVLLIAVMEQNQFQEMSDDFTSRFSSIIKLDAGSFQPDIPQWTEDERTESCFVFGDPLLSFEHFLGYYSQNNGQLQWHEGWLTQQIKQGIHQINLINPPTDLSEFKLLMHSVLQGYYYSNGELINVPQTLSVTYKRQKYDYPPCTIISAHQKVTIDFVLNKSSFMSLLRGTYELLDDGSMVHHPALNASRTNGCTVLLSESLNEEEWYSLLCSTHDSGLSLRFALASGVTLPESLIVTYSQDGGYEQTIVEEYTHLFPLDNSLINWVESDNILKLMNSVDARNRLTPIYLSHDGQISDLVGSIVAQEGQPLTFLDTEFNRALRQGKEVVVYGNPNHEVRHYLESLLCTQPYLIINGTKQYITGPLSLYFTPSTQHSIIPVHPMAEKTVENNNRVQHNPGIVLTPHSDLEHQLIHEIIPRIEEQRISVISGLPQSGKSYLLNQFVSTYFNVHHGIAHLDSWLTQGGILLIDHCHYATLEEHSLIEQLHNAQNTLYIKGQFYPLFSHHKMLLIVPSAKPLPSFFAVNTQSLHCEPFNEEMRRDMQIQPLWLRLNTQYSTLEHWPVIENMLKQLERTNGFGGINQLFMALAYIDELAQHESQIITANQSGSLEYLCNLALCLLCPAQTLKETQHHVQKIALALIENLLPAPLGVNITPMQTLMVCNLMLHLRLVERARTNPLIAQLLVKGLIIEGSPGIGKTYLTEQLFHAMGYQEVTDSTMHVTKGYVLAPTDDLRKCKEQLMLAKQKGYLIFFDELNTLAEERSDFAERSLIAKLIDALEPNHQEQCSTGFYMIASQNTAASFGNRLSLPTELSIRCLTLHPGAFRKQDYQHLCSFFKAKQPEKIAAEMKSALRDYKQAPNKFKKPTVRALIGFLNSQQVNPLEQKRKRETGEQEQYPRKKIRH